MDVEPDPDATDVEGTDVDFAVLGSPDGGPTLRLDHERFAYAGKFVSSGTGKAVAREAGDVVAAASFDRDRTDPSVVRVRYVTARRDRRGEGLGARLLSFLAERLLDGEGAPDRVREVRIAVNNPFAYEATFKAGFGYTGDRTGLAELVCARPGDRSAAAYRHGLSTFRAREDLEESEREFIAQRLDAGLPPAVYAAIEE